MQKQERDSLSIKKKLTLGDRPGAQRHDKKGEHSKNTVETSGFSATLSYIVT